jgi:hypothetical protein
MLFHYLLRTCCNAVSHVVSMSLDGLFIIKSKVAHIIIQEYNQLIDRLLNYLTKKSQNQQVTNGLTNLFELLPWYSTPLYLCIIV